MLNQHDFKTKNLVLIGGGHAHVHVIKMIGMGKSNWNGIRVTLISRDIETPYSGMLPGFVAGYYTKEECHIDLNKLCRFSDIRLIHSEAIGLDIKNKLIHCRDGRPSIPYDVLSINIGITPNLIPSSSSNITPVKPIDGFAKRWEVILNRVVCSIHSKKYNEFRPFQICVIGAGAGGIELICSIYDRIKCELNERNLCFNSVSFYVLTRGKSVLSSHNIQVQDIIHRLLKEKNIHVILNFEVIKILDFENEKSCLCDQFGNSYPFDEAIWCTGAVAQNWLKESGLQVTSKGCICVNSSLESLNCPGIFSAGDVAELVNTPRPKAGVFAVRAGPPLLHNLRAKLFNEPFDEWIPQEQFLGIIGTGNRYAIASKGGFGVEGEYLWKLKDRIDKTWIAGYQQLPSMEEMLKNKLNNRPLEVNGLSESKDVITRLSTVQMRCGGCGSKIGSQILTRCLKQVQSYGISRSDVIASVGDDAALVLSPSHSSDSSVKYLVHSIDYFKTFLSDPFVIGQIAANHALSDLFTMNAEAQTALAVCVIPYASEKIIEDTLTQLLAGVMIGLKKVNCQLVGGHTSEGEELSIGLSVNGLVDSNKVLRKGPIKKDHVLILTKAIGTGTLLAADMRYYAKASWIQNVVNSMLLSNRCAAEILQLFGCTACTDITGFGLLGHLLEMIQFGNKSSESPLFVDIDLQSIPCLEGAKECIEANIISSLHPENIRCARAIGNPDIGKSNPIFALLFDPQVLCHFT